MTDQKDYTRDEEVLAACGFSGGYVCPEHGELIGQNVTFEERCAICGRDVSCDSGPTFLELWEGLCRVCREYGYLPHLECDYTVWIHFKPSPCYEFFNVSPYGSLPNTVAAALHWVLQQKREG